MPFAYTSRVAILSTLIAGCGGDPGNAVDAGSDTAIAVDSPAATPTQFGVRLEPPLGRVIHGQGQWDTPTGNAAYVAALGNPALAPAIGMTFFTIDPSPRPWTEQLTTLRAGLASHVAAGRIPQIDIQMKTSFHPASQSEVAANPYFGLDDEVANSTQWDDHLRDLAHAIRDLDSPMWVRLTGEFNGWWSGQHPGVYPLAFRKVVELFRAEGATNAVFIWCYEPAGPGDFDTVDNGVPRWYPGDDVVDWFGLDIFHTNDFSGSAPQHARSEQFLAMAQAHNKPVILAESSAAFVELTASPADGEADWAAWFAPYFDFIAAHPQIEAFQYINVDWTTTGFYGNAGWKNANIATNEIVRTRFIEELSKPKYLHSGELSLVLAP